MKMETLPLELGHVAAAGLLVFVAGAVSLSLGLKLEKQLTVAAVRCLVQLLAIGYILGWVFRIQTPYILVPVLLVMIGAASHAATERAPRTYRSVTWHAFLTLTITGLLCTFLVTAVILRVEPWYRPQYVIPLMGMVLGNSLTGVSLCLDQLLETLQERRAEVEMELALGASRWEAARGPLASAVRRGMIPTINAMTVVGIVSLPGMMTGQILAGTDPALAVRYQIVVMFLLTASTALGCIGAGMLACRTLFNDSHQLRISALTRRRG